MRASASAAKIFSCGASTSHSSRNTYSLAIAPPASGQYVSFDHVAPADHEMAAFVAFLPDFFGVPGGGVEPPLPGPKPGVLSKYTTPERAISLGPTRPEPEATSLHGPGRNRPLLVIADSLEWGHDSTVASTKPRRV